jgi:hypothetical protein
MSAAAQPGEEPATSASGAGRGPYPFSLTLSINHPESCLTSLKVW